MFLSMEEKCKTCKHCSKSAKYPALFWCSHWGRFTNPDHERCEGGYEAVQTDDRCKTCIWACKRDFDTTMILCRYKNLEVWAESVPCVMYERYDENFYHSKPINSAVQ